MNKVSGSIMVVALGLCVWEGGAVLNAEEPATGANVITLQQAIRMAFDRAPELALARTQIARAGEALRETRALNLPQIATGTGLAYNNGFPLSIEGAAPAIIQFGLVQAFLSKKNKNLILEAEENRKSSQIGTDTARIDLSARVAVLYTDLHHARKLEELWLTRLNSARKQQGITEAMLEAGKARPLDVSQARATTAGAQQQLLVAREQVRLSETGLREITGIPAQTPIETVPPPLEVPALELPAETLYQRALENHPEIQRAEAELRGKEFHTQAERAEYYPRLEVVSQYALFSRINNYQDYFNRFTRNNYLLGLSIQVPLFNGYRTSARVAQSQQEAAAARLRLQHLKSVLKLGVERSASQLRVARGALDLAHLEFSAAQENFRVNQALFEGGRIGGRQLESIRAQLQEKELGYLEAEKTLRQRQVDLLQVSGSLSELF